MRKLLAIGAVVLGSVGALMAATYDNSVGGTNGYPAFLGRSLYTINRSVDFSTYTNTVAADDVVKLINIPATSIVLQVCYRLPTATTNDTFARIYTGGDNSTIVGQIDATNPVWATEAVYTTPTMHVNNDDIRVSFTNINAGSVGKVDVTAVILDVNHYQ
jgi:hypothetical protein